jgi:hypothetical protein
VFFHGLGVEFVMGEDNAIFNRKGVAMNAKFWKCLWVDSDPFAVKKEEREMNECSTHIAPRTSPFTLFSLPSPTK